MLDRAEREGLQLNSFHQLGIKGKRAIGQFYNIPCIDDPKLIVPFLRDIYQDTQQLPVVTHSLFITNLSSLFYCYLIIYIICMYMYVYTHLFVYRHIG